MSKYTQLNEGLRLMAEGDEKFNHKGWFGGNKWDEAADLYGRAGNAFKLQKQFKESGDAYKKQGEVREKLNERDEASNCYLNASKSYKKEFPQGSLFNPEAATTLTLAISILIEKGRFSAAASSQKQLAEIYESDLADLQKAMDAYDQAGEWYSAEDASAQANACFLKVAQFAGTLENYDRAIRIFEQVAEKSLGNNLTKWSVREYFLKAGICHLCSEDHYKAKDAIQKYKDMDPTFEATREFKLLDGLLHAVEEQDSEEFSKKFAEFDAMTKMDPWKVSLLLRAKKNIEKEDYT